MRWAPSMEPTFVLKRTMPQWIHDRADHIRAKNPGMPKSESFAIATEQAYAAGKTPSDYGTPEGKRKALRKYDEGKSAYKKTADPKSSSKTAGINLDVLLGFSDELSKIASDLGEMQRMVTHSMKSTKPGNVSKPSKPNPPDISPDHLRSIKTNPPPPITAGGF